MSDLEKIKSYYSFDVVGNKIFVKDSTSNGPENEVPMIYKNIYFTFGNILKEDNLDEMIESGKIIAISGIEIYRHFFGWNEDEIIERIHNMDVRTFMHLKKIKEKIGFIEEKHGWHEEKFEPVLQFNIWHNTSEVEIGQLSNGNWVSQYGYQTDIDDYNIARYYFSEKPTRECIEVIKIISDLEFKFKFKGIKPIFRCWECGKKAHFLDLEGNISDNISSLMEEYCGC